MRLDLCYPGNDRSPRLTLRPKGPTSGPTHPMPTSPILGSLGPWGQMTRFCVVCGFVEI